MATEEETLKKTASGNVRKYADNILPMARIKKIMKMDPNITDQITIEANYLVCSATEIFIRQLVKDAFQKKSNNEKDTLDYKSLAKFVQDDENLDFLHAVLPEKITVSEYKRILAEETQKEENSGSDYESSEEEESDEEEEAEEEESEEEEDEKEKQNLSKNDE